MIPACLLTGNKVTIFFKVELFVGRFLSGSFLLWTDSGLSDGIVLGTSDT